MAKTEVIIGKFDILATFTYAKALLDGETAVDTKQRGIVAAIMGAKAKSGHTVDHKAEKTAAEKKKKTTSPQRALITRSRTRWGRFSRSHFCRPSRSSSKPGKVTTR